MAPSDKKVVTPKSEAKVAEKKAKKDARKKARKEAKARVLTFLAQNEAKLGPIAKDIATLVGKGGVRVTSSIGSALRDALLTAGPTGLPELTIYKQFKIGRPEMQGKIRKFIRAANPADRVWVHFDEAKEAYFVVGQGATPPKGWDGYLPSAKEEL